MVQRAGSHAAGLRSRNPLHGTPFELSLTYTSTQRLEDA